MTSPMLRLGLTLPVLLMLTPLASGLGPNKNSGTSRFSWTIYDRFDQVNDHISAIDASNCMSKTKEDLVLRPDVVSQLPVYNKLLSQIWYKNRTNLIHLHNMALNRAFFYSYIQQKMNDSASFNFQPNWLYMYMSATADVNANPNGLNGSAIYFDANCHYPNWYETVPFNKTLPLFGPKAWRHDDFNDQDNLLREPTRQVAMVADLGAGRGMNYTHPLFKMNPWYTKWLPDLRGDLDSLTKFTYYVGVKYSRETGRFVKDEFEVVPFFGPSMPSAENQDDRLLPVVFTQPYFDCGRSNKWVVSTVSPVVDFMPRYTNWTHLRRQRVVAAVVMDIDFLWVDFNPCNVGKGNPGPSYLSGVHRCRKTTNCKHVSGRGFHRGGYKCNCRPGYHWPWEELVPSWDGSVLEQATEFEYYNSFKCLPTDYRHNLPAVDQLSAVYLEGGNSALTSGGLDLGINDVINSVVTNITWTRNRRSAKQTRRKVQKMIARFQQTSVHSVSAPHGVHAEIRATHDRKFISKDQMQRTVEQRLQQEKRHQRLVNLNPTPRPHRRRKRASVFDQKAFDRVMRIFRQKESVRGSNCHQVSPHNLIMPGDVAFGVHNQFEREGRTALRLAHFLCSFLQNTDPSERFGNLRGGGRLHEDQMFGEVIANVMGNFRIYSAGLYFDRYQFHNQDGSQRELFGPWAFRRQGGFYALDSAGLHRSYIDSDWFQVAKSRWSTNFKGLKEYKIRPHVRSDPNGTSSVRHEHFPLRYRAPLYSSGHWTRPHFRCDGLVDAWVVTYVTPFFGLDSYKKNLEFKGVVTVDVPLGLLELNPCPMGFGVANAFKNTARCHYLSSSCKPIPGYPFMRGAYSCRCLHGFEYMHNDGKNWLHGTLIEMEYEKKVRGLFSRLDQLRCRVAASPYLSASKLTIVILTLVSMATVRYVIVVEM